MISVLLLFYTSWNKDSMMVHFFWNAATYPHAVTTTAVVVKDAITAIASVHYRGRVLIRMLMLGIRVLGSVVDGCQEAHHK